MAPADRPRMLQQHLHLKIHLTQVTHKTAELENEAEQENKAEISQVAIAGQKCEGIAVFCANAAINNAKVEQDNDAKQGNVNVQTQTDDSNGPCSGPNCPATSTVKIHLTQVTHKQQN